MIKQELKIFRDNVHGYIKVPLDYVKCFIDTEIFQRLRNIEQTGMRTLYPSARHDRFIHSLGTYHLGHIAFLCFKENVKVNFSNEDEKRGNHYIIFKDSIEKNEAFWDKCEVLFGIACLLHDCGHAPFSHTLEFYYEQEQMDTEFITLKDSLKRQIGSREFYQDFEGQGSPHELMSAMVVCTEFRSQIDDLIKKYKLNIYDDSTSTTNVELIARMIIGCEYKKATDSNQIYNCLINLLNSNSIDVDSLDYIIRDSKLSGIDNMSVDVDRLLGSLTLVEITNFDKAPFNDFDIETNIINGSLEKNKNDAILIGRAQGQFLINEHISGKLSGMVSLNGMLIIKNEVQFKESDHNKVIVNGASSNQIHITNNISTVELYGFTENNIEISGQEININDEFNGQVNISAEKFEFGSTYINARLNGIFTGDLLGNYSRIGGKLRCQLGYHKSSLSVIQNVIIARNYEYQWIYSHHKVVYSSNYLIIELLRTCLDYLIKKEKIENEKIEKEKTEKETMENVLSKIFSYDIMINHSATTIDYKTYDFSGHKFFRPTDSDIISIFKRCQVDCINDKDFDSRCYRLLTEYFTRKYKKSLWKSYAEFNIFFGDFSSDEKKTIHQLFMSNTKFGISKKYGYFIDEWQIAFEGFGMYDVVWVNGDSKLKILNPDNTFIQFKNTALTYRTVSNESDFKPVHNLNLFYIYYNCKTDDCKIDVESLKHFIREKLGTYNKSVVI